MPDNTDERMNAAEIRALAQLIDGIDPGYDRSEAGLRELAADLRLGVPDQFDGPRDSSGRPSGIVCTAPVDGAQRPWTVRFDLGGVSIPLSRIEGDAGVQAAEFARAAKSVEAALRTPDYFGAYRGTFLGGDRWGAPYMRWRGKYTTTELAASPTGPVLSIDYTEMWEEDYRDAMSRRPSGFIGSRSWDDLLYAPSATAGDWVEFTEALAALLSHLPAETSALGVAFTLCLYGRLTFADGTKDAPIMFDIRCGERLHLGYYAHPRADPAGSAKAAPGLGWSPTPADLEGSAPEVKFFDNPWYFDGGGPADTRAREAAELLVRTAKAAGVRQVGDLLLGEEAHHQQNAYYRFPGLRLGTA
ncbi:hypothetical protein AB0B28_14855 [Glycomyces sp. NPDC046736]|uniref:hypothetical protein n=1 Tax=Glycomyces sp. NPDC046736 TaxID=3155615 RepID=UPI0033C50FAD